LQAFAGFCRGKNVQVPTERDGLEAMRVCEQIRHAIERE